MDNLLTGLKTYTEWFTCSKIYVLIHKLLYKSVIWLITYGSVIFSLVLKTQLDFKFPKTNNFIGLQK